MERRGRGEVKTKWAAGVKLDDVLTTLKHNYVDFANLLVHYQKICTVDSRTAVVKLGCLPLALFHHLFILCTSNDLLVFIYLYS